MQQAFESKEVEQLKKRIIANRSQGLRISHETMYRFLIADCGGMKAVAVSI
jgi:hypothetical protein